MSETKINELVTKLNTYRHEYYNLNAPSITDAAYDRLFDELKKLESETGIIMSNSPTQTAGYEAVSSLDKIRHEIPLLSLDKTKVIGELITFANGKVMLLMHKLDGLTLKLVYEGGRMISASTRGDGNEGESVIHNIPAISGVPMIIPYRNRLVITGEGHILNHDFEEIKDTLLDSTGKPYRNARNLAAGSIRCLDPSVCVQRKVRFTPFNVLEGLDEEPVIANSKFHKLLRLQAFGFSRCQAFFIQTPSVDIFEKTIKHLDDAAKANGIPIDGIVATYNDIAYSLTCGRTGHHYKDGMAYKFEDDLHETVLRSVEWNPSRSGEISPVAIFDTVIIDGTEVSRASLHNLSFIEELQLHIDCRILVSKRNMIIPHVEDNLDRDTEILVPPDVCPCCGGQTTIRVSKAKDSETKTLHCENEDCPAQIVRKFVHFVSKKAMDIEGLSKATLEKFIDRGWLQTFADIYNLKSHANEIILMDGFGSKQYAKINKSIEKSRHTTFERFLIAMDIPLVGSNASANLKKEFNNDLCAFRAAVESGRDFTSIQDVGEVINTNIHTWFADAENCNQWDELFKLMTFEKTEETASPVAKDAESSPFFGLTIVVTGSLKGFTRTTIKTKLEELGAKASESVSSKTNLVIIGEKPGKNKLDDAQKLGVKTMSGDEFLSKLG